MFTANHKVSSSQERNANTQSAYRDYLNETDTDQLIIADNAAKTGFPVPKPKQLIAESCLEFFDN